MKTKRFISTLLALLLICGLPVSAFADTWYLENGDITVNATESGQTVTQGAQVDVPDSAPVITQSDSSTPTTNTVTITATGSAVANVTLEEVNIVISDDALTNHGSDEAAVTIDVADNASANVTLDSVNIDVGGTGGETQIDYFLGVAAVQITGNGDVTLELDGENTVQSGCERAGVEKNTTEDGSNGKGNLTITDKTGFSGSLNATGGLKGAGIGGGSWSDGSDGSGSNITISGNAEVTANGGSLGAGIGGGSWCDGSNITITGNAKVTANGGGDAAGIGGGFDGNGSYIGISGNAEVIATGGKHGAGIGGGNCGSGSNITISGSAEVTASGGETGAGIGDGYSGIDDEESASNITVSQNAQVKAQGGSSYQYGPNYYGAGAAIGEGGKWGENSSDPITGKEISPNTYALNKGWVATYAPGTEDMNTANPKSLTFKAEYFVTTTHNAEAIPKKEPTCTEDGTRAGFMVYKILGIPVDGIKVGGETLPATGHSMGKFHTETAPTCQQAGLERSDCKNCDHYVTRSLGTVGHNYGEYTSDNNATCTSDGTKSRKCIWCQEPDPVSVPDPGSKLEHELEFHTVTAPTCQQEGLERGDCKNCSYYETNILKKVDHSYGEYTSDNNDSCTSDGTKSRKCIWCQEPDPVSVPDPGSKLEHELGKFYTVTAPTCQQEGLERADCKNCSYYETNILKKVDHSYGEYISNNNASCTSDGTKTAKCIWCGLPDTVPDTGTMKEHSFTNYVSDGNATYDHDGTKTAKCDHCDATDTVTDPGSRLVWVEDAPLYRVIDQDGKALSCKAERKDGVLTITVEADFAALTGKLGGIQTLKAQGIDTIVFVTNGATSTFALSDLLAQTGDTYTLTHDGSTVTFTLNNGGDVSAILQ